VPADDLNQFIGSKPMPLTIPVPPSLGLDQLVRSLISGLGISTDFVFHPRRLLTVMTKRNVGME